MDVLVAFREAGSAQIQVVEQRGTVLGWDLIFGDRGQSGLGLLDEVGVTVS
ncbi:hypothetical protein [Streptomyces phaeochromogenes]|uniref:hypothetical protein n=1 Tax=Streptomyces phaeochromogenes TaxID=1923 RepID=UPI0033F0FA38